jgi:phosphoribosylglycinamide formyltransferase-1
MERQPPTQFVSRPLKALYEAGEGAPVVVGEPVFPKAFVLGPERFEGLTILEKGKAYGPCTHGSGERYLRRHTWRVRTGEGEVLELYFERSRPGVGRAAKRRPRWFLRSRHRARYGVDQPRSPTG